MAQTFPNRIPDVISIADPLEGIRPRLAREYRIGWLQTSVPAIPGRAAFSYFPAQNSRDLVLGQNRRMCDFLQAWTDLI
jgi:hypothetical protein